MDATLRVVFVAFAAILTASYMGKGPLIVKKLNEILTGKKGCVPVPDLGNVTLHYFNIRGLGEGIRLMLEDSKIPYTEISFENRADWLKHKEGGTKSGLYTFGQEDIRSRFGKTMYKPGFKISDRDEYLKDVLPAWLAHFERIAPKQSNEDPHFASGRLTWIDFAVFEFLEIQQAFASHDSGALAGAGKIDILEKFPNLGWFYGAVAARKTLTQYLNGSKRRPFTLPKSA